MLLVNQGGTAQLRFQPRLGRYLAAAADNVVSIFDVETQARRQTLQVEFLLTFSFLLGVVKWGLSLAEKRGYCCLMIVLPLVGMIE